jgi:3-dehydroquinate synthase
VLEAVVARCVAHKARVVERDELETLGERATLNLGHSLGHVLENRFPNRYLHGEAVGVGLLAALRVSQAHTGCPPELAARVRALLEAAGLATDPPEDLHAAELLRVLGSDKKRESGVLRFVALSRPGSARLVSLALDAALAGLLLGRT